MRDAIRLYGPVFLALAAVYLGLRYVVGLVLPFLLAIALAVLIDPWVGLLQQRLRAPRAAAAGIVLLLLIGLFSFLLVIGIARLVVEVRQFEGDIPDLYRLSLVTLEDLTERFGRWQEGLPPGVQEAVREQQAEWISRGRKGLEEAVAGLAEVLKNWALTGIPNALLVLVITGIATFFISKDKAQIRNALTLLIPRPWREQVVGVVRRLLGALVGFTNAFLVLVMATALATTLGLTALGTPYALLIGILSGVLDVLPVIGPSLLFIPWIAYHLLFGSVVFGIKLGLLYGTVTGIRFFLQAQVIGDRIGIHPLSTLAALYIGLKLLGPVGVIIGPLVVVLLKAMAEARIIPLEDGSP